MGCVTSKFVHDGGGDGDVTGVTKKKKKYNNPTATAATAVTSNHIVSLTSSTYGVLNLDRRGENAVEVQVEDLTTVVEDCSRRSPPKPTFLPVKAPPPPTEKEVALEVINAWELMRDLDVPVWSPAKKPAAKSFCSPAKTSRFVPSPIKKSKKFSPKENNKDFSTPLSRPRVPFSSLENKERARTASPALACRKSSPVDSKIRKSGRDSVKSLSRRSSSPLFDPDLLAALEKELHQDKEQWKQIKENSASLLKNFEEKCPPGGEQSIILYTTTLRGIRKTFEDCNRVRRTIEAHEVGFIERDISMDSGFREELRVLSGSSKVKVPLLFVKGRLIGGAEEVLKLEEEGKFGLLMEGMPRAASWCEGCGGVRFVMCRQCNGSCKVRDDKGTNAARCGICNENGLIHCPLCS